MQIIIDGVLLLWIYNRARNMGMSALGAAVYAIALDVGIGMLVRLVLRSLGIG